ncbi:DUF6197 family protein [Mycobacterium palustre]|uniref:Uncharacterized protein n=1 Tax=Mycobacterium palustre TaxID=153971 RepID=A0A1X1ZCC6_9MYCO|nr:hypothetical protein [Mycobacterium palustre]MCV7100049.1 hypothetical protein [Mycobacterium palustre]ORW20935.1 hypothetical protein AWC19_14320 [Mycobacterium palustre]
MRNLLFAQPEAPPPPAAIEIIGALEQARLLLGDGPGLAKHHAIDWVDGWPCYCLVAAITHASRTKQIRDAAIQAVMRALPGALIAKGLRPSSCRRIEDFNDHPSTTVEDAKTVLQRAKSYAGSVAA